MDWKEALLAQSRAMGIDPANLPAEPEPAETPAPVPTDRLHVTVERKGRAGKTATIIEGFTCSSSRLKEVASILCRRLGTGGSARGGEILVQGDRRDDVILILKDLGYRVK